MSAPHVEQAIFTASTQGRCGRVAVELAPARDGALLQLLAAADDLEGPHAAHSQMGSARPQ